jgi:phage repressor protein C with HTH and peptisase S24 domain
MLTHAQIWSAIDTLAQQHGLSASALAKKAGLDATTFNRSKRISADGNPRWPSTESIAKILAATGVGADAFMAIITGAQIREKSAVVTLPFRTLTAMSGAGFDESGQVQGQDWDQLPILASIADCFAIALNGPEGAPVYRDGDILIASRAAERRRGDRVIIVERKGVASLAELVMETASHLRLRSLAGDDLAPLAMSDVQLVARILWVSQ